MNTEELAKNVISALSSNGVTEWRYKAAEHTTLKFKAKNREITPLLSDKAESLVIDMVKGGKKASAAVSSFDAQVMKSAVKKALESDSEASVREFPQVVPAKVELWDSEIKALIEDPARAKQLIQTAVDTIETEAKYKGVELETAEAYLTLKYSESIFQSSKNAEPLPGARTSVSLAVGINDEQLEYEESGKMLSPDAFSRVPTECLARVLKDKKSPEDIGIDRKNAVIILAPDAVAELLEGIASNHFSLLTKQQGLSKLERGMTLSELPITLHDNPLEDYMTGSYRCDDEGIPGRKKTLIENGVFKMFVNDLDTAQKANQEPTGNAARTGNSIRPVPSNLIMEPGQTPLEEMLSSVDKGILAIRSMGTHSADDVTGNFNFNVNEGLVIENGKYTAQPSPGSWVFKTNGIDFMKQIIEVSRERKNLGTALLPWIKIRAELG
ncbi:MAG: TldD/PmbA family protein [DPANN group archaeon]|nr:TldD/PmbA family protein [DPANN group archaeon]